MLPASTPHGRFIVFDGPDGAGKTTVLRYVAAQLRNRGCVVTQCKDPGGTVIGDRIRSVILDHDLSTMNAVCETLLFMASRAQLVNEVVRPALAAGQVVLCDRFVSATCAYQVAAGAERNAILDLAQYAIGNTWPDLTLILDVPYEIGLARVRARAAQDDRTAAVLDSMESRPRTFHEAVRQNFLDLAEHYPTPIVVLDACPAVSAIAAQALKHIGGVRHEAVPPQRSVSAGASLGRRACAGAVQAAAQC